MRHFKKFSNIVVKVQSAPNFWLSVRMMYLTPWHCQKKERFFLLSSECETPSFCSQFFLFSLRRAQLADYWEGQGRGTTESNGESAIIPALELPEVRPRPRKWFIRYLKLRYWELSLNFSFLRYHHIWLKNHSTLYKWKSFEL